ncbi:MAG TPA: dUTP diphosphatase [Dehalococcoidia bacterium]|nr:dUTP diphosphatase [Dehalococcoidia bacterium]
MPEPALKVKLLRPGARVPSRGTPGASGLDLHACLDEDIEIGPDPTLVPSGIAVEVPYGYEVQVRPRSGLARRGVNVVFGTADSDYRGEIFVNMYTFGTLKSYRIQDGDRIAQMVVARVEMLPAVEVDELSDTSRGEGGFGSTGR